MFRDYFEDQAKDKLIDEKIGFLDTKIWNMLYDFQKDGVRGVINKILKHNGCIIADSVGLGKTFEALAVIKYFELLNRRVLVLCPKKLKENWKDEFKELYKRRDDNYNFAQETRDNYLIGMMEVNYLKRLESSVEAFEISMKRTIGKISYLENKIKDFINSPSDNGEDFDETLLLPEGAEEEDEKDFVGDKLKFNLGTIYDVSKGVYSWCLMNICKT